MSATPWPASMMSRSGEVRVMTGYTAVAERCGGWWAVRVREQPGVFTQAKRLDQVESMVRDALAAYLDTDPRSFEVGLVQVLPDAMAEEVRRARQARERASRTQAEAGDH
jgi:predicted RNase H-like HicB family nuclease